ncbi:MAG: peptidoglycan DD-metalloendopeptidase family protein [Rhodospirillaceae bacterium]|nr:peptidoglycan DD-metalloendopeptidase family protein [Rhodospirillaceae bacterium]MBL6930082.1 peptidoglycan DD-metalloendopeptidase family protein [Rhodospirillales bacterium]MBL6940626.1 peptidoglycan DD-metalloendopeptidase family protein [Rhodospirillales bacterium]
MKIIALLILMWGVGLSDVTFAAETSTKLKEIEKALDKDKKQRDTLKSESRDLARDLERLKAETVKVAATIQGHESAALDLQDRLAELALTEKDKLVLLEQRREQFGFVLMALQRMARYPPEAMIAAPMSPSDTVRGAILLRAAVPAIEDRALSLRQDLAALTRARKQTVEKRQQLASVRAGLDVERQRLDGLLAKKLKLKKSTDSKALQAEERIRALVKKSKNLQDLMARLKADKSKRKKGDTESAAKTSVPTKKSTASLISKARGTLPYPVIGHLVGRYGQAMETGLTRKGITIETGAGAQVVVPHEGTVVFAGPFKGYGRLLIIEHGEGYHSLLAGLDRIDNVIGQLVLSGEPAGIMGGLENGPPVLYVELRRNGQPINPVPWLAARKIKVNG